MFVFRLCVALLAALALAGPALADAVLVEGTLVDASGGPASGTVEAYLGGDVGPDGTATLEPLATAIAAADGRFSLSLAPTQDLADVAAANGGYLNVDLVGESGGDVYYQAIVRRYEGGAWLDGAGAAPRDADLAPTGPRAPGGATICILRKTLVGAERRHTAIGELHNASDVAFSRLPYGRRADSEISVGFSATGATWSLRGSYHVGNLE